MTYIENIFLCLAIPMILSLFFIKGRSRSYTLFVTIGMGICLLSAYVNSFFMWLYGVDGTVAAIEITPVCEECDHWNGDLSVECLCQQLFYVAIRRGWNSCRY